MYRNYCDLALFSQSATLLLLHMWSIAYSYWRGGLQAYAYKKKALSLQIQVLWKDKCIRRNHSSCNTWGCNHVRTTINCSGTSKDSYGPKLISHSIIPFPSWSFLTTAFQFTLEQLLTVSQPNEPVMRGKRCWPTTHASCNRTVLYLDYHIA